jgi:putative Holliday junction resolvase
MDGYNGGMRLLGLDLGSKRIGVAVSDEMGWTAQGLTVLNRHGGVRDLENIARLVSEQGAEAIVLGLPINMDGSEGEQARKVRQFAEKLKQHLDIEVHLWDERLTTWEAEGILKEAGVKGQKRKQVVDKVAAALILKSYLQARENTS